MGLVHIYCGDGKGKTSAACGLAVRMAGRGNHVVIARFLKTDDSGEVETLKQISNIHIIPCEKEFGFIFAMDDETKKEAAEFNTELFQKAVQTTLEWCKGNACSVQDESTDQVESDGQDKCAAQSQCLLVLDEIMAAVNFHMVPEALVLEFLKNKPENLEVVLTGRDPSEQMQEMADYISEVKKVRHPFEKGISARIGIEY